LLIVPVVAGADGILVDADAGATAAAREQGR
jgi:hypothetical protein